MKRSIETRSFPNLLVATPRDLTFYVADPISSIRAPVTTGNRYRAELEHRIGMVTTALPFKCGKGDTFKS